jgi:hypothetical protein
MGITNLSLNRMKRFGCLQQGVKMLELGCQNIYVQGYSPTTTSLEQFPKEFGVDMETWDILGCQNSKVVDLRKAVPKSEHLKYDVVTDFGTTEHVDGKYYQARKNIHDVCRVGGLMIHETPLTGHWIGHGHNYLTTNFYNQLANAMKYEVLELTIEYAMGNTTDGGLVVCVLRKTEDLPFVDAKTFETFEIFNS